VWASAAEGLLFSQAVAEFTEKIRTLGPLKWPKNGGFVAEGQKLVESAVAAIEG